MSRVMIVENTKKPLWLAKKLLTAINYEIVFETGNGFEAIEKYDLIKPDLLLLDLNPSKSDGFTVIKEIKKNHPDSQIIILTPLSNPKILEECVSAGALNCINIPFRMQEFVSILAGIEKTPKIQTHINPIIIEESSM